MRVLYTDPAWALADGRPDPALATIEAAEFGTDVELELGPFRDGHYVDGDELLARAAGADAIVVYRRQVTAELLDAAGDSCRVFARQGVGLDNLNVPLLRERGRYGFHVPDYCGDEVSTHAVALLLALERGVCVQDTLVKADEWAIHGGGAPRRTSGLRAGIVGFGRIGKATSRKLAPFYREVLAYDPYVPEDVMAGFGVVRCERLDDLLARVDAVVLHPELTDDTAGLIGTAVTGSFRPGTLLVNVSRGRVVDAPAVLEALRAGHLGGFAFDVFSPEDPNRDPAGRELLKREDVIASSHRAFLSRESEASLRRRIARGVAHVLRTGEPPADGRVA